MHRREFISFVAGGAAAVQTSVSAAEDACEYHARLLAQALAEKHGAEFVIKADLESEFVIIHKA